MYSLPLVFLFIGIVELGRVFRKRNQCLFVLFLHIYVLVLKYLLVVGHWFVLILLLSIKQVFSEELPISKSDFQVNLKFPIRFHSDGKKKFFLID